MRARGRRPKLITVPAVEEPKPEQPKKPVPRASLGRYPPAAAPGDVTITVSGALRFWVAEALLAQIQWVQEADRRREGERRIPARRADVAAELRDLYEEVVP